VGVAPIQARTTIVAVTKVIRMAGTGPPASGLAAGGGADDEDAEEGLAATDMSTSFVPAAGGGAPTKSRSLASPASESRRAKECIAEPQFLNLTTLRARFYHSRKQASVNRKAKQGSVSVSRGCSGGKCSCGDSRLGCLAERSEAVSARTQNFVNRQKLHDRGYPLVSKGEIFLANMSLSPFAA
jgi:hypothetical protein